MKCIRCGVDIAPNYHVVEGYCHECGCRLTGAWDAASITISGKLDFIDREEIARLIESEIPLPPSEVVMRNVGDIVEPRRNA